VSLIKAYMPLRNVNVLPDWYDKLFVTVKWDDHFFSYWFRVHSGACLQFL